MNGAPVWTYDRWVAHERHLLRAVARLAGAYLHEPTDPAMAGTLDKLRNALADLRMHQAAGTERGWNC